MGEARTLKLHAEESDLNTVKTGSYVYIPPEVLQGELYTSASDVYSMGIFVWELWHNQQVFGRERDDSIEKFRSLKDPSTVMMSGVTRCPKTSGEISRVVKECMAIVKEGRPSMAKFEDRWRQTMTHLGIGNN